MNEKSISHYKPIIPRDLIPLEYVEARGAKEHDIRVLLTCLFLEQESQGPETQLRHEIITFVREYHKAQKEFAWMLAMYDDSRIEKQTTEQEGVMRSVSPPPIPASDHLTLVIDMHNHPSEAGLEPSLNTGGGDLMSDHLRSKQLGNVPFIAIIVNMYGSCLVHYYEQGKCVAEGFWHEGTGNYDDFRLPSLDATSLFPKEKSRSHE